MTKRALILKYLKCGYSLTKIQCITNFGYLNLGGYIHVLRDRGYNIETNMLHSSYGADYASYTLKSNA